MGRTSTFTFICIVALAGCGETVKPDNSSKKYIDLAAFFKSEGVRLQKSNPLVSKEIAKNNSKESRKLKIRNWTNELSVFAASDINKSAWKDSYDVKTSGDTVEYLAKDADLRTRKIIVERSGNTIKHISILNNVSNILYSSSEELDYYMDSLYSIRKKQKVVLMGDNDYFVFGKLK